ncbi:hypothetical protein C0J52_03756 [Blattella germanica]|nr:hypothetical protein C0J52_03756 [Blattella germanica]
MEYIHLSHNKRNSIYLYHVVVIYKKKKKKKKIGQNLWPDYVYLKSIFWYFASLTLIVLFIHLLHTVEVLLTGLHGT